MVECADGSLYTGWTTNPQRRVAEHNAGRGARYTRARRPVQLVYVEAQPDRSTALKREYVIRKMPRPKKMQLIENALQAES